MFLRKTCSRYLFSSPELSGVSQTSCAHLVKLFVVMALCEVGQVICQYAWFYVHFYSQFVVVTACQTVLKRKASFFFNFFGKLDVGVRFINIYSVTKAVSLVNKVVHHNFCDYNTNRRPLCCSMQLFVVFTVVLSKSM